MKLQIKTLTLSLRRSTETIDLPHVSYFYGPIGSGKSSIGRLIDFCLGGTYEWTPALQSELVSASISLSIADSEAQIERDRQSNSVRATWTSQNDTIQSLIPIKSSKAEIVEGTDVHVLSDLLFYLAKEDAPYVRKRKGSPDERLERLGFRDLFRFCYLDQDGMDSEFFRLNSENYPLRAKSVDALRYLLGYQTERVSELESDLQSIRERRLALLAGSQALEKALTEIGIEDPLALDASIEELHADIERARKAAKQARNSRSSPPHAAEELRERARSLAQETIAIQQAHLDIDGRIAQLERHQNELQMLSVRFQRTAAARTVLGGVNFDSCPRCTQILPDRTESLCAVCGQPDHIIDADSALSENVVDEDLKARRAELKEVVARMKQQRRLMNARMSQLAIERAQTDQALAERLRDYDSAFLSQAIQHERVVTTLEQKLNSQLRSRKLLGVLAEQKGEAAALATAEVDLRTQLEQARKAAFKERRNVEKLGALFLDCLARIKFPDVRSTYSVEIDPTNFFPRIPLGASNAEDALVVLSFDNAGSGGMKALFKTCFAISLHRLCVSLNDDRLPTLLIIDTPTKNVSSIENPAVIDSFFRLVYELAATELKGTQIIVIDNEHTRVPNDIDLEVHVRHMVNGSSENPPLVPYLTGDFSTLNSDNGPEEQ